MLDSKGAMRHDGPVYYAAAAHVAKGHGFVTGPLDDPDLCKPSAFGNPVYPAFLAAIFRIFGFDIVAVLLIQSVVDTLTCLLVFAMAQRTVRNTRAANLAALFYAVYPPLIISTSLVMTETLTLLLLTGAVYFYWQYLDGRLVHGVAAGAVMGLSILLRPAVLALPPFMLLGFWLNRKSDRRWLARGTLYVMICWAVVSPWTIRNYFVTGGFIPVSSHGGLTLWHGSGAADGLGTSELNRPLAIRGTAEAADPERLVVSKRTYRKLMKLREQTRGLNELESDEVYRKAAIREIREHPGRFALLAAKKFFRLWFNLWHDKPPSKKSLALATLNLALLLLAVKGALAGLVERRFVQAAVLLAVYTSAVCMVTFSVVRYSYPVFPFVFVMAAAFLARIKAVPRAGA